MSKNTYNGPTIYTFQEQGKTRGRARIGYRCPSRNNCPWFCSKGNTMTCKHEAVLDHWPHCLNAEACYAALDNTETLITAERRRLEGAKK